MRSPGERGPGGEVEPEDEEAKRARRIAEHQIIERLREVNFDISSAEWLSLASALYEYGYAVLSAWAMKGVLGTYTIKVNARARTKLPHSLRLDEDDARALASEVVVRAAENFRTKSLPAWTADRGASIKTYFIGRCLMDLPDVYQGWHRRERRHFLVDDAETMERVRSCDPSEQAEMRIQIDEMFADDPDLRRVFELRSSGYELKEIVNLLNAEGDSVTVSGLNARLYRFRKRLGIRKESRGG